MLFFFDIIKTLKVAKYPQCYLGKPQVEFPHLGFSLYFITAVSTAGQEKRLQIYNSGAQ